MNKLENLIIIIIGKINAISTSKIKKIIVIKKNRIENGRRDEDLGSNPHSKGDAFSRSTIVFLDRIDAKNITIIEINIIILLMIKIEKIIYTINNRLYDWKSNILFILYRYKIILLINKLIHIRIVIQYQQNVNIKQQLQIQNGDFLKNDY